MAGKGKRGRKFIHHQPKPLYNDKIRELLNPVTKRIYRSIPLKPAKGMIEHEKSVLCWEGVNEDGYWLPIPSLMLTGGKGPLWGYEFSEDKQYLIPIPEQLNRLQEAKEYVKKYSYDTVARWLSAITGRKIGYNELYDRINGGRDRQKRAAQLRRWAICFKKAIDAAQKIEEASADAGEPKNYTEEGVLNLARKADFQPLNSIERYTPAAFDDGTTPEEGEASKKRRNSVSRRGPRRPNRTRAIYRGKVKHL